MDVAADGALCPAFRRLLPKSVVPLAMAMEISSNASNATTVAVLGKYIGSLEHVGNKYRWYVNDA